MEARTGRRGADVVVAVFALVFKVVNQGHPVVVGGRGRFGRRIWPELIGRERPCLALVPNVLATVLEQMEETASVVFTTN